MRSKTTLFLLSGSMALAACAGQVPANRDPAASDSLFTVSAPVDFTLKAPLGELFAKIPHASEQEEPAPVAADQEPRVNGTVSYLFKGKTVELPVEVVVRGQSSKQDCPFPKLKLKFDKKVIEGTIFDGNKTVGLGTHCDENQEHIDGIADGTAGGRVGDERSVIRESLAYEILHTLGVASPLTRVVNFRYVDAAGGIDTTHAAFFLEDNDRLAKRAGGERVKDWLGSWKLGSTLPFEKMRADEMAKLLFGEALLGNEDLNLALPSIAGPHFNQNPEHPIWNLYVVRDSSGHEFFVAYDFDFATSVTGHGITENEAPKAFADFTGLKEYYQWVIFQELQSTRSHFSRAVLEDTIRYYQSKRAELENLVAHYPRIDDAGRTLFKQHLATFYSLLEKQFFIPVNTTTGAAIYNDEKKKTFCLAQETPKLPVILLPGMPARILRSSGAMVQMQFLDVRLALTKQTEIGSCVDGPVWVDKSVIVDANYPAE